MSKFNFQAVTATTRCHRQAFATLTGRVVSIMAMTKQDMCSAFAGAFLLGAAVAAAAVYPALAHAEEANPADARVTIDNFAFAPQRLTVKAGTTVIWRNEDDIPHTVAASTRLFKSKALDTSDTYSFTFTTPGTYEYFCSLHPHMTGIVVVEGKVGANVTQ